MCNLIKKVNHGPLENCLNFTACVLNPKLYLLSTSALNVTSVEGIIQIGQIKNHLFSYQLHRYYKTNYIGSKGFKCKKQLKWKF